MRSSSPGSADLSRRCWPLLGAFVEAAADCADALEAAHAALARVQRSMSVQDPASALSRLNREAGRAVTEVDDDLRAVLRRALFWAVESDGAFDPTIGAGSWRDVELAPGGLRLHAPVTLHLCGIAKGYAVDLAVAAMRAAGATRGLVNAGGDLAGFGPRPWPVTVVDPASRRPAAELWVENGAAATSAARPGSLAFDHLPRARNGWLSATVVAPACIDADALTKVVLADGPRALACLALAEAAALRLGAEGWSSLDPRAPEAAA